VLVGSPLPERLPVLRILPHPTRAWRMVPNEEHFTYQHRVRVNSHGLRGREIGPKRPGVVRVLALGDSLTYGQGVADDRTLPAQLESFLNARDAGGRTWEVVNAGHRAYDMRQEIALARELAPELQPDHVIVFWFRDDLAPRDIEGNFERIKALPVPVAFDTGTRIEGWNRVKWQLRQCVRRSALLMFAHDALNRTPSQPLKEEIRRNQLNRLDGQLDLLNRLARELSFRPWFAPIPHRLSVRQPELPMPLQEAAVEHARARGIATVDLSPGLLELYRSSGELPVLPYDGHYDPEGNRVLAEAMAAALLHD